MGTYKYKGQKITASSREEAIRIFANKQKKMVTAASIDIPEEIYESYGNEYLENECNNEEKAYDDFDELLNDNPMGVREAIDSAYAGYDFIDGNDNTKFNPNEDYVALNDLGNFVSIRKGFLGKYLKYVINSSRFAEWLKDNKKEEYLDLFRDKVEEEIEKVISKGKLFGWEIEKLGGYEDVKYDRDLDTLSCFGESIDYDYDESLDANLQNLWEAITEKHPNIDDDDSDSSDA